MTHDPADILIISAGASGAAVAWRLSDAGLRIVCLEQGRWHKPGEYSTTLPDWEFRGATSFSFNPNVRALRAIGTYLGYDMDIAHRSAIRRNKRRRIGAPGRRSLFASLDLSPSASLGARLAATCAGRAETLKTLQAPGRHPEFCSLTFRGLPQCGNRLPIAARQLGEIASG